jgi:hypothetical protein
MISSLSDRFLESFCWARHEEPFLVSPLGVFFVATTLKACRQPYASLFSC